jgi:hypothetical protein
MHRFLLVPFFLWLAAPVVAQRHDLGLLLGASRPASRTLTLSAPTKADLSSGLTFSVSYAIRLTGGGAAALYFEIPFAAAPRHSITSAARSITRDLATLYLTPGLRVRFAPAVRVSPYAFLGGGYALFEHSKERIDGAPNQAPRHLHRGALTFGGGVDVKVWRIASLRGEIRGFASGSPGFNAPVRGSIQHNLLAAAGIGLRF